MSKPGLGLLLGFEDTMADFVELAREGEAAGMESMYTVEAGRSAFVSAAAVIAATERVTVGTYIANVVRPRAVADGDRGPRSRRDERRPVHARPRHRQPALQRLVHGRRRVPAARQAARLHPDRAQCRGWAGGGTGALRGRPPPDPLAGELGAHAAVDSPCTCPPRGPRWSAWQARWPTGSASA